MRDLIASRGGAWMPLEVFKELAAKWRFPVKKKASARSSLDYGIVPSGVGEEPAGAKEGRKDKGRNRTNPAERSGGAAREETAGRRARIDGARRGAERQRGRRSERSPTEGKSKKEQAPRIK